MVLSGIALALCAEASAHIRVQNGVFVDENCKEFLFSGYNAWQVSIALLTPPVDLPGSLLKSPTKNIAFRTCNATVKL